MKYIYGAFLLVAIAATSCKKEDTSQQQGDPRLVVPFTQQTNSGIEKSAPVATAQNHNLFQENNTRTTPSVAAGINPAHGQPNHRCDVAVGAPLNTSTNGVAQPQVTNVQPTKMVTTTQTAASKTVTPKGMNPPHGENGHRCDISVGAPLNSKTASTTPTTVNSTSTEYTVQQPVPTLLSTDAAASKTTVGMNPAHGKEGHRCDIAVGAPLSKE